MINRIKKYPISQLLRPESDVIFQIYEFQRRYNWGPLQWDGFLKNLTRAKGGHCLGTIVCSTKSVDSFGNKKYDVVDGLQRLTTLCIILSTLYSMLRENKEFMDDDQLAEFNQIRLILKKTVSIIPQKPNRHLGAYNSLLVELGIFESDEETYYKKESRVFRAFSYFRERIEELVDFSEEPAITTMLRIFEQINRAVVNIFEVSKHTDSDDYSLDRSEFPLFQANMNNGNEY